jgi:ubiquinol-cytochrome c reductase cytochrome b/c1 subunit
MNPLRTLLALIIAGATTLPLAARAQESSEPATPPRQSWSFSGPFGRYDQGQLQRGFKVYREVCANCHGLTLLHFRNLAEPGGPGFSEAQAATVAAEYKIKDGVNDQGDPVERPGRLADAFPKPFENDAAAKAVTGGALPPDMSVLAKARTYERGFPLFIFDMFTQYQEQGPDYIAALLQGYREKPAGMDMPANDHYNIYFPGHMLGMPPPLQDGQVTYDDGAPETLAQYSKDIAAFLMWAAEPHLDARKRIGFQVMIFLVVFALLLYFTKKRIWKEVELHPEVLQEKSREQPELV